MYPGIAGRTGILWEGDVLCEGGRYVQGYDD